MTDRSSLSHTALELLASQEPEIGAPTTAERTAAVDVIARAIVERARARRRRQATFGVLAVAASVALVVSASFVFRHSTGLVAHGGGGVTVSHAGTTAPLHDGVELSRGDRVHVEKGATASLDLSTGTRIEVEGGSDLSVVSKDGDQVFGVESGATRFVVAKVPSGKRFLVRTADVEVEVRGTVFKVGYGEPACEGTPSRVMVTEGLVVVRHGGKEILVPAGKSWPESCAAPSPVAAAAPVVAPPASTVEHPAKSPTHASAFVAPAPQPATTSVVKSPSSDLAEQNDVFAEATSKKRNGDRAGAIAAYDKLLARWPGSALAETATIERMRLLEGNARRDAAKAYLARWSNGSARAEAESILAH